MNLDQIPLSSVWRVARVRAATGERVREAARERVRQLEELGFLPGEPVSVLARGAWGGEPLAVRVGLSTFALRREEARCIEVEPSGA